MGGGGGEGALFIVKIIIMEVFMFLASKKTASCFCCLGITCYQLMTLPSTAALISFTCMSFVVPASSLISP